MASVPALATRALAPELEGALPGHQSPMAQQTRRSLPQTLVLPRLRPGCLHMRPPALALELACALAGHSPVFYSPVSWHGRSLVRRSETPTPNLKCHPYPMTRGLHMRLLALVAEPEGPLLGAIPTPMARIWC